MHLILGMTQSISISRARCKCIGFKSVFLVSNQPHIVSNGYKVKFSEGPDKDCGIGYIVPEWIYDESFVSKLQTVYGSEVLPTTTIVLPLKADKVKPVTKELSSLHPELLLFLSKLSRLYVHENVGGLNNVTAISIVSDTNVVSSDKDANLSIFHLSVKEKPDVPEETCRYYLWRQSFAVTDQAKVSERARADVKEWIVSLAFPFGKRLKRGTSSVGVFAFLPTSMVTKFPFVIQADFILTSSRESIVFDSKWNQGILECVPVAFYNAFMSCVKQNSPMHMVMRAFKCLPVHTSPFPELNNVREAIQKKLCNAEVIPCETFNNQIKYCKPASAVRILPSFRQILIKMKETGVTLSGIASMKMCPVHSSLDQDKFKENLDFLGVCHQYEWYGSCADACNLVAQASDDIYIDFLYFYSRISCHISIRPNLLKFTNSRGCIEYYSSGPSGSTGERLQIRYCVEPELHVWLQKCNIQFSCPKSIFFLPNPVQVALTRHPKYREVSNWLSSYAGVKPISAFEYSSQICDHILHESELSNVIAFSHFLYHCKIKKFLTDSDISVISKLMPIIDGSGTVRKQRNATLVTASGSKWTKLFGSDNPFIRENYVDISDSYAARGEFAAEHTPAKKLLDLLSFHAGALDLPEIPIPNSPLQVASLHMSSEQAILLLDWIRFHRTRGASMNLPENFIKSIRCGKWMKTKTGFDCPSKCTLPTENGRAILELLKDVLSGFSIVDEDFYGDRISLYVDELMFLGVQCGINGVQNVAMDRFKLVASSSMKRETAFSLLLFIGFMKARKMLDQQWLKIISFGKWMKTHTGHGAPRECVLYESDSEAEAAHLLTSLQVVDGNFYGGKLPSYLDELKLLGLKSEVGVYSLAAENLSFPANPSSLTSNCGVFVLNCIRNMKSPAPSLMENVCGTPWLKTSLGFKCPSSVILENQDWACILKIFSIPVIDEAFYGDEIRSYMDELTKIGVAVELGDVLKIVVSELKNLLSQPVASEHLLMLLHCLKKLKEANSPILANLCESLRKEEILRTRHGHKKPEESILFNSKWASISLFVDLPLIDDSYYGIEIYKHRDELKMLGVLGKLEEGAIYVAEGLSKPIEQGLLSSEGTLSLLQTLKILRSDEDAHPFLDTFIENIMKSELLMTSSGCRLPKDTILFHSDWREKLEVTDAPFIDDKYYGMDMSTFLYELKKIGVKVHLDEVCSALLESLPLISETPPVKRIYGFLKEFHWKPTSPESTNFQVWIPTNGSSNVGMWVDSKMCVLYDKAHHFAPILYSLDTYYEKELLPFFSNAFQVIDYPSTSHYMQLWSIWESRETHQILETECCFFWGFVLKSWNQEMEDTLKNKLTKVPALSLDGTILLVSKEDAVVPDDVSLKKMFLGCEDSPLSVWLPKSCLFSAVSPSKLCAVYYALGVKKISECVERKLRIMSSLNQPSEVVLKEKLIVKGLINIILGFLACKLHMPTKERHEVVRTLLSVSVFESNENIRISYKLLLRAEKCLERDVVKLVHWDKKSQKLFINRGSFEYPKTSAEFVNSFAAEIAYGLLSDHRVSVVNDLQNLIQMGFLFEFQEHPIQFLLTKENIEVLIEDEEFFAAAFSEDSCASSIVKRTSTQQKELFHPSTPSVYQRVKRRRLKYIVSDENEGKSKSYSEQADCKMSSKTKVEATNPISIKPKKPPMAFSIFLEEFRKQYKLKHAHESSVADVRKAASVAWKAMSNLEKGPYIEDAEKRKMEYEKELKEYYRKMEDSVEGISL